MRLEINADKAADYAAWAALALKPSKHRSRTP